ncbi:MAG: TIGR04282 family arsenosugar biosynthesis glycosyltransferase [Rubrivivax sp.]|nr:TIGR04282 family arsenosugar biosynthesis glycosyltransferase [Rubrivivax sp.]
MPTTPELRIAILAKAPLPGLAKTRLTPALGAAGAAALAERMLRHAAAQASGAAPGRVTLWTAPDATHPVFTQLQLQHGLALEVQPGGDLGARMAHVFATAFAAGAGPLLLMGSDIPALDAATLARAAASLQSRPAVFVPALDGGYTLVGLRAPLPGLLAALFEGMTWSTPQVMHQTRQRLAALGVSHAELPALSDIDEPDDLARLPPGWFGAG